MATTGLAICRNAALELGYLDPLETLSAGDAQFILDQVNKIIDNWNADRDAVYADVFTTYTLVPSLSPHTIGPVGATFTAPRPVTIDGAALLLPGVTPVKSHLRLRDARWWQRQAVVTLASSLPTDLYYDPTSPLGSLYLWPVPTTAYPLELHTRQVLTAIALTTVIQLPPGYEDALTLTTAEKIAPGLSVVPSPMITLNASQARARLASNNRSRTRLRTCDDGLPGSHNGLLYNYRTGGWDY